MGGQREGMEQHSKDDPSLCPRFRGHKVGHFDVLRKKWSKFVPEISRPLNRPLLRTTQKMVPSLCPRFRGH